MDPRSRRSRDRLTSAVIEYAAAGRLDDVSVSELSRSAGVTRDTFYRHASSVTELLAVALAERLHELVAGYEEVLPPRSELGAILLAGEVGLLEHIADLGSVYRTALSGQSAAPVRRTLTGFLQSNLEVALHEYPDIGPLSPDDVTPRTIGIVAAYAASGTVGAIETWLESGDYDDVEGFRRILKAGAPAWWVVASTPAE